MTKDPRNIAEAFNRLFELKLDWDELEDGKSTPSIRSQDSIEFVDLCRYICEELSSREMQAAIWTLTQNKHAIFTAMNNPASLKDLDFTADELLDIRRIIISGKSDVYIISQQKLKKAREAFDREGVKLSFDGHVIWVPADSEYQILMKNFYPIERELLLKAGLNQAPVSIILARIQMFEKRILRNLSDGSSVLTGKYLRALDTLKNTSESMVATAKHMADEVRLPNRKKLAKAKNKIAGIATLWGDALPLIISRDWGIASVVSTTAGATVAAVLPSGERDGD